MTEQWREVVSQTFYSVSDYGRVRNDRTGKILRPWPCGRKLKYLQVNFSEGGVVTTRHVSHIVLEAFVGPRPEGHDADHKDADKTLDNSLSNLRWRPMEQNRKCRRYKHPNVILTEEKASEIRQRRFHGETYMEIAKAIGVSKGCVSHVINGRAWR